MTALGSAALRGAIIASATSFLPTSAATSQSAAARELIQIESSVDRSLQPSYLLRPARPLEPSTPLVVLLHTWSFDLEQRHPVVEEEAARRGWLLLVPNFRGKNDHPEACGSTLAQRDVVDAIDWVRARYPVDSTRIYLLGMSGGGFMALLMAGRFPDRWAAVSAWVGIADLTSWYRDHATDDDGAMARRCFGGAPETSDSVRGEYRSRSPATHLARAAAVPIEIAAGRSDPEVAFEQSVTAFNVLARAVGAEVVPDHELAELKAGGLIRPAPTDTANDSTYGRPIRLRRAAGPSRLTIFDGGHQWVPRAAMSWLAAHRRAR